MTDQPLQAFLRRMRQDRRPAAGVSDAELLDRFIRLRDEAAFELLVRRHERMVLGVCRRVLGHEHDAEDAFQATFLVLARKAGAIARRPSVASWLYKVAYRTALHARAGAARAARPAVDLEAVAAPEDAGGAAARRELCLALDEEVNRLPETYRTAIVLCYLEGKTYAEAARQLGCPRGTVSIRLTRARERLRGRLVRRGLALPTGLLAAWFCQQASAAGPPDLVGATVKAALGGAAGRAAVLTEGVLRAMFMTRLKIATALLLGVGLLVAGAFALRLTAAGPDQPRGADTPKPAAAKAAKDQEMALGAWKLVKAELQGRELPMAEQAKPVRFVVQPGKFLMQSNAGLVGEFAYTLDPTRDPKEIDITPLEGPAGKKGKTLLGIYLLEGDNLKVCVSTPGQKRPTQFGSKERRWELLYVLKRETAARTEAEMKARLLRLEADNLRMGKELLNLKLEYEKLRAENAKLKLDLHKAKPEG
jgi:RNA polymerase sigma factor (sigma-70 family)